MYHKIAWWMVEKMHRNNPDLDDQDAQEICAYGIEITLSSIINYLLLLMIGYLTQSIIPAVIFGVVFTIIRLYIGGYHCTSYLHCNLTFCVIYILVLMLGKHLLKWMDLSILLLLLLWCGLGLWFLGPVENAKKPTTPEQRKRCHIIAMLIYIFDFALTVACYSWVPYYGIISLLSLAAVVILLPIGTIAERRRKSREEGNRKGAD